MKFLKTFFNQKINEALEADTSLKKNSTLECKKILDLFNDAERLKIKECTFLKKERNDYGYIENFIVEYDDLIFDLFNDDGEGFANVSIQDKQRGIIFAAGGYKYLSNFGRELNPTMYHGDYDLDYLVFKDYKGAAARFVKKALKELTDKVNHAKMQKNQEEINKERKKEIKKEKDFMEVEAYFQKKLS